MTSSLALKEVQHKKSRLKDLHDRVARQRDRADELKRDAVVREPPEIRWFRFLLREDQLDDIGQAVDDAGKKSVAIDQKIADLETHLLLTEQKLKIISDA